MKQVTMEDLALDHGYNQLVTQWKDILTMVELALDAQATLELRITIHIAQLTHVPQMNTLVLMDNVYYVMLVIIEATLIVIIATPIFHQLVVQIKFFQQMVDHAELAQHSQDHKLGVTVQQTTAHGIKFFRQMELVVLAQQEQDQTQEVENVM